MLPTALHLHVCSPMLIAGHSETGDPADIDVHTDRHGLPEIPAGRITSRLRDAALEVAAADPALAPALLTLLGAASRSGPRRALTIAAARPTGQLRAAVAQTLAAHPETSASRFRLIASITNSLTLSEFNTATDRHGAPAQGTLRSTRMLRPGIVLIAPLTWTPEITETSPEITAFARIVLGLRQLGGRESDARGHVDASIDGNREHTIALARLHSEQVRV